jgi:hypothetical protein
MVSPFMVFYASLMLAFSISMTAWRLAAAQGKVSRQVDGMLGACLVGSCTLFVAVVLPGAQLP